MGEPPDLRKHLSVDRPEQPWLQLWLQLVRLEHLFRALAVRAGRGPATGQSPISAPEGAAHLRRGLLLKLPRDVLVGVAGEPRLRVAEDLGDHLDVDAALEQQRGAGV